MDRNLLRSELARDEGVRLAAYRDSLGYWTIGIGHYLGTEKRMSLITRAEADALLNADIDEAISLSYKLVPYDDLGDLDAPARRRALVNMAFNLGPRLGQFKRFLASVKGQAWRQAAIDMMDSKWATQVGARAVRLSAMIRGDA